MLDRQGLLRLIQRISDGLASALKKASGGEPDEALEALRQLCSEELGMDLSVLSMLDPKSAVDLLGSHQRVFAFVQILEAMADIEQVKDPARALIRYRQAFQVGAVLNDRDGEKAQLVELLARVLSRIS